MTFLGTEPLVEELIQPPPIFSAHLHEFDSHAFARVRTADDGTRSDISRVQVEKQVDDRPDLRRIGRVYEQAAQPQGSHAGNDSFIRALPGDMQSFWRL
jgi:hypothetical protein